MLSRLSNTKRLDMSFVAKGLMVLALLPTMGGWGFDGLTQQCRRHHHYYRFSHITQLALSGVIFGYRRRVFEVSTRAQAVATGLGFGFQ